MQLPYNDNGDCFMKSIHSEIGNRIRQYRKRSGLSQEKLALNAGIAVSFLGDIERNVKKPSIESLEKLLSALNVTFLEFFDYEIEIESLEDCSSLKKLTLVLQGRSDDELELIYSIAKQIFEYNDITNSR